MTELSPSEQARFPLPPHGRWFAGTGSQNLMLEVYHEHPGSLAVGWDTPSNGKMFGVYSALSSKDEFMYLLLDIPWAQRHCYELLVENVSCRAYVDMEWEGPAEPDHSTLQRLVAAIRGKIRELYSKDPRIYVCCSSRTKAGDLIKHSYHIVCENIVFERNNDGQMKALFTTIPGFTWMDGVEEKSMVDSRVYTKNRHFRLPHCCKMGSQHQLLRISGDPLMDEFGNHSWGRDVPAVLPFFLSNPPSTEDCVFVPTPASLLLNSVSSSNNNNNSAKGTGAKRARTQQTDTTMSNPKIFPVPLQIVQRLLHLAGDTVSALGTIQYLPEEDQWQIQGDQRGKGRKCLASLGTTHTSNNCLLFIERFQAGFKVHYFCTAGGCSHQSKKTIIGYISMNTETYEWQIALSPAPIPVPQVEEEEMQDSTEPAPGPNTSDHDMEESMDCSPQVIAIVQPQEESVPQVEPPVDLENPALNTYDLVKARFEIICFKVKVPFCYARIERGHDPCLHSHTDLQHYFCDWKYWGLNKDDETVRLPFIVAWLQDPNKRVVERIVVDPTNSIPDVYNMWRGFIAEKISPVDAVLVSDLIQPITRHFDEVVTLGVQEHTEFIHHYLANMLQRPWLKTQVAISLFGVQGCGKGIIFEFFRRKILGEHCSYQTSKPENDLFGRFANGAVNRVCIQVDEVKSLHDHADQLKDFITNPTVNYEKKGKDTIVVSNLANLILTSNNANALTVSADDRRFALFHCSSVHKGDIGYFNDLGYHLERPEVARAYYQYLMALDLSAYPTSFQHKRPITTYYKEAQQNSIPIVSRFFSALVNTRDIKMPIPARELYQKYEQFHISGNYKFLMTEHAFGREIKKVNGISVKRSSTGRLYQIDHDVIKTYLVEVNEYDADADF